MEISYHITEICNLNCVSCLHFIPISNNKKHRNLEVIKHELDLLSKHKNIVNIFNIMGGEPTLHPQINEILFYARKVFPQTKIGLATNGVNTKIFYNIDFLNAIKNNNIIVRMTEYNYTENARNNYDKIYTVLDANNIQYEGNGSLEMHKKFLKQPFSKELHNNITNDWMCKSFHYCTMLKDNKLYVCHFAAYIDSLLDKFPEIDWIKIDENAYVDLEQNVTDDYIANKLCKKSIICEHCVDLNRWWFTDNPEDYTEWKHSELKKEEWIKE